MRLLILALAATVAALLEAAPSSTLASSTSNASAAASVALEADGCDNIVANCTACLSSPGCGFCQRSETLGICLSGNASGPLKPYQCGEMDQWLTGSAATCSAIWCENYVPDDNCETCVAQFGCAWCAQSSTAGDCRSARFRICSGVGPSGIGIISTYPGPCILAVSATTTPLPASRIPAAIAGTILGPLAAAAVGGMALVLAVVACTAPKDLRAGARLLCGCPAAARAREVGKTSLSSHGDGSAAAARPSATPGGELPTDWRTLAALEYRREQTAAETSSSRSEFASTTPDEYSSMVEERSI